MIADKKTEQDAQTANILLPLLRYSCFICVYGHVPRLRACQGQVLGVPLARKQNYGQAFA